MKNYCVMCVFKIKPNNQDKMKEIIDLVYIPSLKEDGCLEYRWYQSSDNPLDYLLFMTWRDKESFDAHVKTEHVVNAEGLLNPMLREPYSINNWNYLTT